MPKTHVDWFGFRAKDTPDVMAMALSEVVPDHMAISLSSGKPDGAPLRVLSMCG